MEGKRDISPEMGRCCQYLVLMEICMHLLNRVFAVWITSSLDSIS